MRLAKITSETLRDYLRKHPHLMKKSEFKQWLKQGKLKTEVGSDTAGADNMGSYRSIAVDDPFAGRIQVATALRRLADEVESMQQSPQFDPRQDTYDSESIEKFIETLAKMQSWVARAEAYWKKQMAQIEQDQLKAGKLR
jgi:hypothetical protein